ncbi:MAG: hypothetical protein ACF8TS_18145, partial [Maioricimonas sp. JB049]
YTFRICGLSLAALVLLQADRAHAAQSIAEFNRLKSKWDRLVGVTFELEGRYSLFTPKEVRFRRCEMRFVLDRSFPRPRDTSNIGVSGRLTKVDGDIAFLVIDLKPMPSDMEALAVRRAGINTGRADSWYAVADWARQRGTFYDDDELLDAAKELYRQGLLTERSDLDEVDAASLARHAERAAELDLSDRFIRELHYEAVVVEFERLRKLNRADLEPLRLRVVQQLPAAKRPVAKVDAKLLDAWTADPVDTYRKTPSEQRDVLDRLLYRQITRTMIERDAEPDDSNALAIAGRVEKELPELSDLAESYRKKGYAYEVSRADRLSRREMLTLAERFRKHEDFERATQVIEAWLAAREPVRRREGALSLIAHAEDYIDLLSDKDKAAALYQAALALNPDLSSASDWLRRNGWTRVGEEWLRPGEMPPETVDPLDQAVREGRVQVGMTEQQAKAALGGKPEGRVRLVSLSRVEEIWLYPNLGVAVRLSRNALTGRAEVVSVSNLREMPPAP